MTATSNVTATTQIAAASAVSVNPDKNLWLERNSTIGPVVEVTGLLPDIANIVADYTTVNDATNYAITPSVWRQLFPCLTEATFPDVPFPENIDAILQARSQFELESPVAAAASCGSAGATAAAPLTEQNDQARVVDREVLCYIPPTSPCGTTKGDLGANVKFIDDLIELYFNVGLARDPNSIRRYIPLEQRRWVLLTRNLIKGSATLSLEQQIKSVSDTGYTIPKPVEIITCCLIQNVWTGTRLYDNIAWARCLQDPADKESYVVRFHPKAPKLDFNVAEIFEGRVPIGIGAMRTLPPAKKQGSATISEIVSQPAAVMSASTATASGN
jgi:hypothetical protein